MIDVGDQVYFFTELADVNEKPGYEVGVAEITKISSSSFYFDLKLLNPVVDDSDNEPLEELFSMSVRHIAITKDELKSIVEQHLERIKVRLNHDIDLLEDL